MTKDRQEQKDSVRVKSQKELFQGRCFLGLGHSAGDKTATADRALKESLQFDTQQLPGTVYKAFVVGRVLYGSRRATSPQTRAAGRKAFQKSNHTLDVGGPYAVS